MEYCGCRECEAIKVKYRESMRVLSALVQEICGDKDCKACHDGFKKTTKNGRCKWADTRLLVANYWIDKIRYDEYDLWYLLKDNGFIYWDESDDSIYWCQMGDDEEPWITRYDSKKWVIVQQLERHDIRSMSPMMKIIQDDEQSPIKPAVHLAYDISKNLGSWIPALRFTP